jgi:hypothetical protein
MYILELFSLIWNCNGYTNAQEFEGTDRMPKSIIPQDVPLCLVCFGNLRSIFISLHRGLPGG